MFSVSSRILTSACEFAQMINSLKFLPKDFTTLRTPCTNFFALNLLFQDTSHRLALKYSSFCLDFSVSHFTILISGSKSVKFAQKFRIFLKFPTLEGTLVMFVMFGVRIRP